MERCRSPLNPKCGSTDIAAYIIYGGVKLPVCSRCWEQIAELNMEWGEGVSAEKLRSQVEEAKRRLLKDVERQALEELAERTARRLKRLKP
jgi:hypothetical protein